MQEINGMRQIAGIIILAGGILASGVALAAERTITLGVSGMTCASCPYIVRESLAAVDGVKAVEVSMLERTATVTYDNTRAGIKDLTAATGNYGFPSRLLSEGDER